LIADPPRISIDVFAIRRMRREPPLNSRATLRLGDFCTDFDRRTAEEAIFPAE